MGLTCRDGAQNALGVAMADPVPGDDAPAVLAGRRQLLLAGCGIALTSVLAPGAPLAWAGGHPRPARPGDQARLARHVDRTQPGRPGNQAQQAWPGNRMREHAEPVAAPRPSAPSYPLDRPLYYIDDAAKAIALTIDDGPSPVYTPQVLALLRRYGVTATFCMVGIHVAAYPRLAAAVAEAGHAIANHTWTHADLAALPAPAVYDQMALASRVIRSVAGVRPGLFRAPYGFWSDEVIDLCEQMRMVPLAWSVDPRDWSMPGVRHIVGTIMGTARPGSIIIEHDGGGNRSQTVAALRIVLPRLLNQGYRFETP
jgi:peptidoglycan-N-acetylglucosamine deacetylase